MPSLEDCQQYSLSTEDAGNRSLIFVKLTDSALQSIETYLKSKVESALKPTIKFLDNSGTISLPLNGGNHTYGFTISNIEGDGLQSSLQCVQQTSDRTLEALGFMLMKMQVHAKEDSYEKTKCKMAAVDQEQKSLCTKEIRQNGTPLGRKVRLKHPGLIPPPDIISPIKQPEPVKFNLRNRVSLQNKVTSPSSLMQQSIRERIIHILAAKSYKKPELLLRLKREGISEKDKSSVDAILTDVGVLRANVYTLASCIWNEVRENWDFSSDEELRLIQKRKLQFCKPNGTIANPVESISIQKDKITEPVSASQNEGNSSIKTNNRIFGNLQDFFISSKVTGKNGIHQNGKQSINGIRNGLYSDVNLGKRSLEESKCSDTAKPSEVQSANNVSQLKKKRKRRRRSKKVCSYVGVENLLEQCNKLLNISQPIRKLKDHNFSPQSKITMNELGSGICNSSVAQHSIYEKITTPNNNIIPSVEGSGDLSLLYDSKTVLNTSSPSHEISDMNEILAQQTFERLTDKHNERSKYLKPVTFVRPLPIRGDTAQLDSDRDAAVLEKDSFAKFDDSQDKLKYIKIENNQQKRKYVKDFNMQYEEYLKLHSEIIIISERVETLYGRKKSFVKGSVEYEQIKHELMIEKNKVLKEDYASKRRKYDYLKSKLSRIRELIQNYDNTLCNTTQPEQCVNNLEPAHKRQRRASF